MSNRFVFIYTQVVVGKSVVFTKRMTSGIEIENRNRYSKI